MHIRTLIEDAARIPNPLGNPPSDIYDMMDIFADIESEFIDAFSHIFPKVDGPNKIAALYREMKKYGKVQRVKISDLVPLEPDVDPVHLKLVSPNGEPVVVYEYYGKMYLNDGNHRAAAAKLAGETHIMANVIKLDDLVKAANSA